MKTVAMVGWTGSGTLDDLERSAVGRLAPRGGKAAVVGDALILPAADPVAAARDLAFLPGVDWVAVGYRFEGIQGYLESLRLLGKRYLSKGKTFRISAQSVRSKESAGDLVLAGSSELLASVAGARVDERRPRVIFRVCAERTKGACGAEIIRGPGGTPTRADWVTCLVSGGERSSSMAWMTALSGFSIRLVHSRTDEVALRNVARLYSELSFRMDPRRLELILLEGTKDPLGRVGAWLGGHEGPAFAGLRPEAPDIIPLLARRFPNLVLPLVLVQEEALSFVYRSLGLGRAAVSGRGLTLDALESGGPYSERRFGGVQSDSNAVIDALKRRA